MPCRSDKPDAPGEESRVEDDPAIAGKAAWIDYKLEHLLADQLRERLD